MTSRIAAVACALIAWLMPAVARACPSCAGREDGGVGRIIALGIMILAPFVIAVIVYRVIRSANRRAKAFDRGWVP
jgi:hypothetical protein